MKFTKAASSAAPDNPKPLRLLLKNVPSLTYMLKRINQYL